MLRAEFRLPSITAEEATPEKKAPIRVKFEIPYFTVSGIQVYFLQICCVDVRKITFGFKIEHKKKEAWC